VTTYPGVPGSSAATKSVDWPNSPANTLAAPSMILYTIVKWRYSRYSQEQKGISSAGCPELSVHRRIQEPAGRFFIKDENRENDLKFIFS
jgi:hypothetical protein